MGVITIMISFPNAKINIGLNIVEKRTDGFHNIESVFYPVQWCDVLEITPAKEFEFKSTGLTILGDDNNNLCVKAAMSITNYQLSIIEKEENLTSHQIHLHKIIPMGAGLGGGSADGAFVLKMLNEMYELNLSVQELQALASKLGSDCAFFIENKPVFCHGRGNEFQNISLDLTGKYIVLVNPDIHISTAEAYSGVIPQKATVDLKEAIKLPISEWKDIIKNDFEEKLLIKYPAIAQLKNRFYDLGATYASMTGSGSTVYGIFETEPSQNDFGHFATWSGRL